MELIVICSSEANCRGAKFYKYLEQNIFFLYLKAFSCRCFAILKPKVSIRVKLQKPRFYNFVVLPHYTNIMNPLEIVYSSGKFHEKKPNKISLLCSNKKIAIIRRLNKVKILMQIPWQKIATAVVIGICIADPNKQQPPSCCSVHGPFGSPVLSNVFRIHK